MRILTRLTPLYKNNFFFFDDLSQEFALSIEIVNKKKKLGGFSQQMPRN